MTGTEKYLLVGSLLFLTYYAARRFNSEPIVLDAEQGSVSLGKDHKSPRADILAQLVTPPLPLFTTTRDRYWRSMAKYVLGYLLVFLALTFGPGLLGPELLNYIGDRTGILVSAVPVALGERMIFALFLLTGVVNAIPIIRIWDEWFIKTLREKALIPTEVKLNARKLLECGLTQDAKDELENEKKKKIPPYLDLKSLPTHAPPTDQPAQAEKLVNRWNTVVYVWKKSVDLPYRTRRYRLFKARFQPEITAIQRHIDEMYPRIHSALDPKTDRSMLPSVLSDLEEDIENLYGRVALFACLLVFSGDRNIRDINERFREIGFNRESMPWPRLDMNAWILSLLIMFVLFLLITLSYEVFVELRGLTLKPDLIGPRSFGKVFVWSFSGVFLFGVSFAIAIVTHHLLRLRRHEQHILQENVSLSDSPHLIKDSAVVFAVCLIAAVILIIALLPQSPLGDLLAGRGTNWQNMKDAFSNALPWSFLVAIAGVFVIYHNIHSREHLKTDWFSRALVHGGLLFAVGGLAAFAVVTADSSIIFLPPLKLYFIIYVAALSFAIGFATPFAFRFAENLRRRWAGTPETAETSSDSTTDACDR